MRQSTTGSFTGLWRLLFLIVIVGCKHLVTGHSARSCGTPELTVDQEKHATRAVKKWKAKQKKTRSRQATIQYAIDIYFHVIQYDDFTPEILDSLILKQFEILNERYRPTPFRFELKEITRTQRSEWVANTRKDAVLEYEINLALNRGGPETLNVYIQPGLCPDDLFAYSSLPQWRGVYPPGTYSPKDKVVLCPNLLPGTRVQRDYDLGMTLVHEVGHWLGLKHTFAGLTCVPNENDSVDDTPQMSEPTYGCPLLKDSCALLPGSDLINNYMDYTDDRCMTAFTPGQVNRMLAQVEEFRIKPPCRSDEAVVRFELQFNSNFVDTQWGMVEWGATGEEIEFKGDPAYDYSDLYVVFDDCIPPDLLHEYFVNDVFGIEPPGFAVLTINGREVSRIGSFTGTRKSVFVSAAPSACKYTTIFIEILFDSEPKQVTWELKNAETQQVVFDYTSSTGAATQFYSSYMANSILHVDRCLSDGTYTIEFRDSGGNGIATPGYWQISTEASVISEGGEFQFVQSVTFVIGENPATVPRSSPPTTLPSTTISPSTSPSASLSPTGSLSPTETPELVASCFASSVTVEVKGKGRVPMDRAQIGDHVLTAKDKYEAIYSFGHYSLSIEATFLEICAGNSTLLISKDHMIFVSQTRAMPASHLRVGDRVVGQEGDEQLITSIKSVNATGLVAPFTSSGRIIVNGILASSFVAFEDSEDVMIAGIGFSYQWLAWASEFPHRVACVYYGVCAQENYTDSGISTWVDTQHSIGKWMLRQGVMVRAPFLLVLVSMLFVFNISEQSIIMYPLYSCALLLVILSFTISSMERKKTKMRNNSLQARLSLDHTNVAVH